MTKTIFLYFLIILMTGSVSAQRSPISAEERSTIHWKSVADIPASFGQTSALGLAGPVTGILHDRMFVGGGANFPEKMPWMGGKKKYYDDLFVYHIHQDTLIREAQVFHLPHPIAYAACISTPLGILFAGGEDVTGPVNKVFLLKWDAQQQAPIFLPMPELPIPLANAAATIVGKTVYLVGGETSVATVSQMISLDLEHLDIGWQSLPAVPLPVSHTVVGCMMQSGQPYLYVAGGRKKNDHGLSDFYSTVYCFSIATQQWMRKASLPYALSAGTGIVIDEQKFYVFGGDRGNVFHEVEKIIAALKSEKHPEQQRLLNEKKQELQSSHPGFSKEVLLYDPMKDVWETAGCLSFPTPVTTTALQQGHKIWLPGGEIKAGIRTPHIMQATIK